MKLNLRRLFRKEVLAEKAYHLDSFPDLIKLNQNELPYDLPPELKAGLLRHLEKIPFQRYPLPQPVRLKKALADRLGVKPEQLQFSNGSNVMIQALILAAGKGRVMTVEPTFSVYAIEGKILGNRVIQVPLEADFSFPLKKFLAVMKARRPHIVFLANPNAPTGNLFPEEALLEVIKKSPGLTVIDEAYFQFSGKTLLPHLKKFPHLVLLRTFSKGYGLGGVRLGYLVAHPAAAEQVQKLLLPYCVSVLSEETALFALERQSHFDAIVEGVIEQRERMLSEMRRMKGLQVFPTHANFILFRSRNGKACFRHLVKNGILVRDVSNKTSLKNCLRVTVGRPEENEAFLRALENFL